MFRLAAERPLDANIWAAICWMLFLLLDAAANNLDAKNPTIEIVAQISALWRKMARLATLAGT